MTADLAAFLLARIAEDEAAARAATQYGPVWQDGGPGAIAEARLLVASEGRLRGSGRGVAEAEPAAAAHIARWDPARVLAECEARRQVVEAYRDERTRRDIYWQADESDLNDDDRSRRQSTTARTRGLEVAVQALALPYVGHPDYRSEWGAE